MVADKRPMMASTLRVLLDLGIILVFVLAFYAPFLRTGLPPGDFGSTVSVAEVEKELVRSPLEVPVWNPYLMCGRPTIAFTSPFRVFELPFLSLDPIARMKALVVLFHVLGGFTMYLLVRSVGAGRAAAVYGGLAYPIMASHVSRTAVHGHVHLPMFYALLPLLFLALLRLRADARSAVVLSLAIAACLVRDPQRTLLLLVVLGLALVPLVLFGVQASIRSARPVLQDRWVRLAILVGIAFALAVLYDSFELVNGFLGDPFAGGWEPGEQARWIGHWSLDNLYSLFDWGGRFAASLEPLGIGFGVSVSRYVGLSLCALILATGLVPRHLAPFRRPFWLTLALFPLSVWLSFGPTSVFDAVRPRITALLRSPGIEPWMKLALVMALLGVFVLIVIVVSRNLPLHRRRGLAATLLVTGLLLLFFFHAPFPWVRRVFFFLREFRNPDWFQVGIASFAVCFPAALAVGVLGRAIPARPFRALFVGAAIVLGIGDFLPFRHLLTEYQSPPEVLDEMRATGREIADDPEDARVLGVEPYGNFVDTCYVWHRKRLAWDFRSYTAPRRTQAYVRRIHALLAEGSAESERLAGILAGVANVKWVLDERDYEPDLRPAAAGFEAVGGGDSLRLWRNEAYRPFVQAYPEAHLLVGPSPERGVDLAGMLAERGIGLVNVESNPDPALRARCTTTRDATELERGPAPTSLPPDERAAFETAPRLSWDRPRPEEIVVSTESAQELLLVVSESFHPWWRARLDGQVVPVYPGQYAFLGVFVPEGRHIVDLRFSRPWTYWLWGWVSLVSVTLALAYVLRTSRRTEARAPLVL